MSEIVTPENQTQEPREWLIRKRGYYYRPNRAGYTSSVDEAGRYTESEAKAEAAIEPKIMSAVHLSEVTEPRTISSKNQTLLPCPFCGSATAPGVFSHYEIHHIEDEETFDIAKCHSDSFAVVCDYHKGGCGAACGYELDKDRATTEWNKRIAVDGGPCTQPDCEKCWDEDGNAVKATVPTPTCNSCGWYLTGNTCERCGGQNGTVPRE